MIEAGLEVSDVADALEMIKKINSASLTSYDTLTEFLTTLGADRKYLEIGTKELLSPIPPEHPVHPLDGAREILQELSLAHQLALVTIGDKDLQTSKIEKAGIDPTLFCKIVISEERNKLSHYQAIIEELKISSQDVIVCGDRISIDLSPGKTLGFTTVQMRAGRGLNNFGNPKDVDFTISHLSEIKNVIPLTQKD